MPPLACGLDFGTSNSTLGVVRNGAPQLCELENGQKTIPSALFFNYESNTTNFGRTAIATYIEGHEGRLMRALKSVLGTSLVHETTRVGFRAMPFTEILGLFLGHLKQQAEAEVQAPLTHVVLGRPVQFVDDNPTADHAAQMQLEKAAHAQGFRHIAFQYEPIAAALDYERTTTSEELAFIVDIGGGTSDFSIVRVGPQHAAKAERKADILANHGVHLGGTDADRLLAMTAVMPHLGYGSPDKNGKQTLPSGPYFDLSTWHRINRLYGKHMTAELRQMHFNATQPQLVERLEAVIAHRQGHALAGRVESAKISLTESPEIRLALPIPNPEPIRIPQTALNTALTEMAERIETTVRQTLAHAGLTPADIATVFLTGGSTQLPLIKSTILSHFPQARVAQGDTFGSVGLGLTLHAHRLFA